MGDVESDVLLNDEVNADGEVAVVIVVVFPLVAVGFKSETETGPSLGVDMVDVEESKLAMVGKRVGFGFGLEMMV
jgi:hypothetical protein